MRIIIKGVMMGLWLLGVSFCVDDDVCTGDHSCIRLSGCPSLSIADNPDPLREDPIAKIEESCVGCGVCGEVAHAAVLCPSFFRADHVRNPSWFERVRYFAAQSIIRFLQRGVQKNLARWELED